MTRMIRAGAAAAANLLGQLGHAAAYSVVDAVEGEAATAVNGWKNAGLPWTFELGKTRACFPKY